MLVHIASFLFLPVSILMSIFTINFILLTFHLTGAFYFPFPCPRITFSIRTCLFSIQGQQHHDEAAHILTCTADWHGVLLNKWTHSVLPVSIVERHGLHPHPALLGRLCCDCPSLPEYPRTFVSHIHLFLDDPFFLFVIVTVVHFHALRTIRTNSHSIMSSRAQALLIAYITLHLSSDANTLTYVSGYLAQILLLILYPTDISTRNGLGLTIQISLVLRSTDRLMCGPTPSKIMFLSTPRSRARRCVITMFSFCFVLLIVLVNF
jgi:hypothetical protein